VTELIYRHDLRPVIQTGAIALDRLLGSASTLVTQIGHPQVRLGRERLGWAGATGLGLGVLGWAILGSNQ
jgi:hypothetical protein